MTSFKERVDVFKAWIKHPLKMLHLLWFICLFSTFISMLILLTNRLVTKSEHGLWLEVNIQIINLLFTILSLYTHPRWCLHFFLLCRWRPEDVSKLQKFYCENGEEKPHERAHMLLIVILFQEVCFLTYFVCALHWCYSASERPRKVIGICVLVIISSAVSAGLYKTFGPLQKKDPNSGVDEEAPAVKA